MNTNTQHIGKILWIPADQEYSVVCKVCGIKLLDDINGLEFPQWLEGECAGPDDAIGIRVEEVIGTKDIFGGEA